MTTLANSGSRDGTTIVPSLGRTGNVGLPQPVSGRHDRDPRGGSCAHHPSYEAPDRGCRRRGGAGAHRPGGCSGAQTEDFYQAQDVTPGPANAPQLDALDGRTKVVTVGIGGNDIGFSDIVKTCALQNPFGSGCKADYVHDGRDELRERIAVTAPDVRQAFADIKARATKAEIFVVGYPTVVPASGNGCYPRVPLLPQDVPYLRDIANALNTMIAQQAAAEGVHYVDVATPSIGHDVCASSSQRWVEGIIPTVPAAPVHPNAKGMAATASVVTGAINQVVTS
ncbi:hypothetical protein BH24ACT4_BH24ACT4_09500 [soil metagenome]